jgi:tRNA(fMet)-specific endonuclease VapC
VIVLDTDHLTVISYPADSRYRMLRARLPADGSEQVVTSVISLEEQMRGWLAVISKRRNARDQIGFYRRLIDLVEFFSGWEILAWDSRSVDHFERLRRERVRIGTQDLKIASIALARGALLLSANLRDFKQVPGLRVENWLS